MKIKELSLYTTQPSVLEDFYKNILGLKLVDKSDGELLFETKNSKLKFIRKNTSRPYHFAFNIASNKIKESLRWLKSRVSILKNKDDDIVDFPAWNAESIYFYDPDKNILEFIARKNLDNKTSGDFSSEDIFEISEIGVATQDFTDKFKTLTAIPGVSKFSGGDEVFCAIGSEYGLFILIDKNRKDWFPGNDKAFSSDFIAVIDTNNTETQVEFKEDTITYKSL